MIKQILVANRGEIAVRIIRTCREMNLKTVAIYSEADQGALHTKLADRALCVGPPLATESYLNANNIIAAACSSGCDAIHPGVGFLAESSTFAEAVSAAGLKFIGPHPQTIALLGDKVKSRQLAKKLRIPLLPGSHKPVANLNEARRQAHRMEYPIMLKAKSGGGGRGIRVVNTFQELLKVFPEASLEAQNSFGDGQLFLESYIANPRHIEIQLLADSAKNVVILGERDCSLQKNHQKIIEEGPASLLSPALRQNLYTASKRLFTHLGYLGAGTVEFLVQGEEYWFLEVNARIQVEHPVSELLTQTDIVQWQIKIAEGKLLPPQEHFTIRGHALECRLNATTVGKITTLILPQGPKVRVDSHLFNGATVTPLYDPLLAKIIVHTTERQQSIAAMRRALDELIIEGINTNREELREILTSSDFLKGEYGTNLYNRLFSEVRHAAIS